MKSLKKEIEKMKEERKYHDEKISDIRRESETNRDEIDQLKKGYSIR